MSRYNPYVHPKEEYGMLNTVGNDGYSFDEKDDDEEYSSAYSKYGSKYPDYENEMVNIQEKNSALSF